MKMVIAQLTDKGIDKFSNEDSILTCSWEFACHNGVERYDLFIVADGIGGAIAGDIASREAIAFVVETLARSFVSCYREPSVTKAGPDVGYTLRSAIEVANARLFQISEKNPSYRGMGSTIVCALLHGEYIHVAHVGDCRMYRLRKNALERLTKDQSLVQLMLDQGKITEEEAFRHELDNVILQGVGARETVLVELHRYKIRIGDVFLLASDGAVSDVPVSHLVSICSQISAEPSRDELQSLCQSLLDAAMDPDIGATLDNLSVIVVYIDSLHECNNKHQLRVFPYGQALPVDKEVERHYGSVLPLGVDSPSYRLYGSIAPAYQIHNQEV